MATFLLGMVILEAISQGVRNGRAKVWLALLMEATSKERRRIVQELLMRIGPAPDQQSVLAISSSARNICASWTQPTRHRIRRSSLAYPAFHWCDPSQLSPRCRTPHEKH